MKTDQDRDPLDKWVQFGFFLFVLIVFILVILKSLKN
jgi:hypothetical protein